LKKPYWHIPCETDSALRLNNIYGVIAGWEA
jgi:hypothetical protein